MTEILKASELTGACVLTFYPTRQIFLPRLIAHARINIASYFSRWTTIFNISALL